ncbi:MAG: DfsB family protein [Acidobacteria bacterium]|nr:MAG: DfsB family protein [Acidobacteriota bacterium]REJ98336.1 MAG: DfsB family protein [Acidobacteriota bacterium]REK17080.1 MAG: DfsB family protein [Acidobacteriota bacterium]REK42990.1 MAG: DfsB family protein [Acidobacteriota bacterium]
MRYESKASFLNDVVREYESLCNRLHEIDSEKWEEAGLWGDDWTLKDLVAHLAEWQHMFLTWHRDGSEGRTPEMPAAGYKWNETPRLNRAIQRKHASKSREAVVEELDSGHTEILALVEKLTPAQLLEPGHFEWTRKYPLTTYLGPNTASHYRFANKVIDRWLRRK